MLSVRGMYCLVAVYLVLAVLCFVEAWRGDRRSAPWVLYWLAAAGILIAGAWIRRMT